MSDRHEAWAAAYPQSKWIAAIEATHQWQKQLEAAEVAASKAMQALIATPAASWTNDQVINLTVAVLTVRAQADLWREAQDAENNCRKQFIKANAVGGTNAV